MRYLIVILVFFFPATNLFSQWHLQSPVSGIVSGFDIEFTSLDTGFVVGDFGVYQTTNAATSWNYLITSSSLFDAGVYSAVKFQNSQQGCAAGYSPYYGQAEIIMTHDGGLTWSPFFFGNGNSIFTDVSFPSSQTGYVVGYVGEIYKTINGGNSWQQISSSTNANLYSTYFISNSVGFAGGDHILLKTTNGGATWQTVPGNWTSITKLQFVNALTGFMIDNGEIYRTADGGATWTWASLNNFGFDDLFFFGPDTGYATTASCIGIAKTLDGGGYWSVESADTTNQILLAMTFVNDSTGYITGDSGIVFKTINAGGNSFFPYNDAGMTSFFTTSNCSDTQNVFGVIKNYGLDTLFNATINWSVNNNNQISFNWSGNLPRAASDTVLVGNYIFGSGNSIINGFTALPNNVTDNRTNNDSAADTLSFRLCIPDDAAMAGMRNQFQICAGINNVYVILRNDGDSILTSAVIECKIGTTLLPSVNWTGFILPGDTSGLILAGSYNFILNQTYPVKTWTSLPNNHVDDRTTNDTLATSISVKGLHGIYTIGGITPDYPDFTTAVADLSVTGICDTVIFNVRPGTYTENVIIQPITQANQFIPVTFQSELNDSSSATLNYNLSQSGIAALRYNKASFITFRELSIISPYSASACVFMSDSSSHDVFSHCHFTGINNLNANNYLIQAANGSPLATPLNYNLFENNFFQYGDFGIHFTSSDSLNPIVGLVIRDNVFQNQYISSIESIYTESPIIENNKFSNSLSHQPFGIRTTYSYDNIFISKNNFSGGYQYAIYADHCRARGNSRISLSNNMISFSSTSSSGGGIWLQNSSGLNIFNNSVLVISTGPNYFPLFASICGDLFIRNNIFQSNGGSWAMRISLSTNNINSDYNNLFTTGPTLARYVNTNYNTLSDIQIGTGNEMHSVSLSTQFVSNTDLHIGSWFGGVDSIGLSIPEITDDIDGDVRSITPDIGADEYTSFVITNISNPASSDSLSIFPNPCSASLTVSFSPCSQKSTLTIYNSMGMIVMSEVLNENQNRTSLDLSKLSDGIYLLEIIQNENKAITKKLIVNKN